MSQSHRTAPVVIAGAGPTGMAAALALDARGIESTILEATPQDGTKEGTRAIYVHGTTLTILERISPGLGHKLAAAGVVWPTRRTFWRDREVFSRTYSNPTESDELPQFTSLPQTDTEAFLREALEETAVDIHWNSTVSDVESTPDGVTVETDDGNRWEAAYLIGADGGGSTVRNQIDVTFDGTESDTAFIIADVAETPDNPHALERTFYYEHPGVGGRNVLVIPFAGGWRIDIQCHPSDDPEALCNEETLGEMIGTILGDRYRSRISWQSTYRFKQVTADSLVDEHRRVLLAGDAAHLFAPWGARGMNSGIADADDAASRIAVAHQTQTESVAHAEIDLYDARRRKAAEHNKNAAGQALTHLEDGDLTTRLKKPAAAVLSYVWEDAGKWLDTAPYGPRSRPPITTV